MRLTILAALLLALPPLAQAAPTWQMVSSEPGKKIEIDRTTIKREEGGKVVAMGRLIMEKALTDPRSGGAYTTIEALTRYDCASRNATTLKRSYRKGDGELLREEELNGSNLPVRSGTLDDKVLREVCRPETPKSDARAVAQKVNDAAGKLREANEALVRKEAAKGKIVPVADAHGSAAPTAKHAAPVASPAPAQTAAPVAPPAAAGHGATPAPAAHGAPAPVAKAEEHAAPMDKVEAAHAAPPPKPKPRKPKPVAKPVEKPAEGHGEAAAEAHAKHVHWGYEGEGAPENWAKLDAKNKVCGTGERQSPIDIRDGIRVDLEPLKIDYRPSQFRIVDNGHTVQAMVSGGSLTVTGKTYELLQFHFHRPSEEKVAGKRYDMVAHLVHKSDEGQLAVIAVLMERGQENPVIQTLWNNMPLEKNVTVTPPAASVDLSGLLPKNRSYFTYMGSLTTPPCTEGVLWIVLKEPVQISQEQFDIFGRLYRNNARPIQSAGDRLIKESR